jgi:hypothetical protein
MGVKKEGKRFQKQEAFPTIFYIKNVRYSSSIVEGGLEVKS